MKLDTTLSIYSGGPGSGCQGPNCGRPATGNWSPLAGQHATKTILEQPEEHPSAEYMRLRLADNGRSLPMLFRNIGRLDWHWEAGGKVLHIEQLRDTGGYGYTMKEVTDVPRENVEEWVPASGMDVEHKIATGFVASRELLKEANHKRFSE